MYTVDICRYENLESLGKCFVPFVRMHLPSAFKGRISNYEIENDFEISTVYSLGTLFSSILV